MGRYYFRPTSMATLSSSPLTHSLDRLLWTTGYHISKCIFFSTHYPFIPNSFVFTFYRMTFRTNRIRLKSDWEKNSLNVPTYCNTIFEKEFNVFWSFFDAFLFGLKEKYFHVNTRLTKLLISYVSFLYPIAFIQYYANIWNRVRESFLLHDVHYYMCDIFLVIFIS